MEKASVSAYLVFYIFLKKTPNNQTKPTIGCIPEQGIELYGFQVVVAQKKLCQSRGTPRILNKNVS